MRKGRHNAPSQGQLDPETSQVGQVRLARSGDGVTVTVFGFDSARDRIKLIWAVWNPEKLRPWTTS